MPDIFHDFVIKAPAQKVFQAVSTPQGLDAWWTKRSSGEPKRGAEYELWFGPGFDWRAVVSRFVPAAEFELEMTKADEDWLGTRVAVDLEQKEGLTQVRFRHSGWPPRAFPHFLLLLGDVSPRFSSATSSMERRRRMNSGWMCERQAILSVSQSARFARHPPAAPVPDELRFLRG